MKHAIKLLDVALNLFDGAGAIGAGSGSAAGTTAAAVPAANTSAGKQNSRRSGKSGELSSVVYGKQSDNDSSAAGSNINNSNQNAAKETETKVTSNTLEEKRAKYNELIGGEYKEFYTADTQRMINRRFAETETLKTQLSGLQPLVDTLSQFYGVSEPEKLIAALENDNRYWEEAAEKAGMAVPQYKEYVKLQRENAALKQVQTQAQNQQRANEQAQKWYNESEQLKGLYPGFDLAAEMQNRDFTAMLKAGVPVKTAYEVTHLDDIKNGVASDVAKVTEKKVTENIKARGSRPTENGAAGQSGVVVKSDVSKLTKADRAEIIKQVAQGKQITF